MRGGPGPTRVQGRESRRPAAPGAPAPYSGREFYEDTPDRATAKNAEAAGLGSICAFADRLLTSDEVPNHPDARARRRRRPGRRWWWWFRCLFLRQAGATASFEAGKTGCQIGRASCRERG